MHYISILSTLVAFLFAAAVFNRYRYKRGAHLLFWGIGLLWYALGTLTEVLMTFTFKEWTLKAWYISGAMLTAAWLGQGTVFLLVRRRWVSHGLAGLLTALSLLAIILVAVAPLTAAAAGFDTGLAVSTQYKGILVRSGLLTFLTVFLNIYGTLILVGGALYSAYLFWRKQVLVDRMIGNLLIAAGALFPAVGGAFVQAGLVDWLYVSEFLGALIMYAGFLKATAQPAGQPIPAGNPG
jgi:hypothetical protein